MDLLYAYKIFITALSFLIVSFILRELIKERTAWGKLIKGAFIYFIYSSISFLVAAFTLNILGIIYGGTYALDFVSQTFFLFGFLFALLVVLKIRKFIGVLK